jgi:phage major head subunit gpT-like protein
MQTTPSNLAFFYTALETRFWTAYTAAAEWHEQVCNIFPVGTEQWVSGWMDILPKFRLWQGPRKTQAPALETYLVPIDPYELTVGVDMFKIMDDKYQLYYPISSQMGLQGRKLWDYQLRDLLQNTGIQTGSRQNGTDGNANFYTLHPVNVYDASFGTYSNDYRGTFTSNGVVCGGPLTSANAFATLWQDMSARPSPNGETLGLNPDRLMHAPMLRQTANTVLQAQFIGAPQLGYLGSGSGAAGTMVGATENMVRGWATAMNVPDLSAQPTTWYLTCEHGGLKPFSILLREAPNFVARLSPTDPIVFEQHQYAFGSWARGNPAWSLPFLSSISS